MELLYRYQLHLDASAIADGRVVIDGRVITNPRARVRADASLRVLPVRRLRGEIKLSSAIDALGIAVAGRVAVDVGASTGGFTTALLDHGASRVYAVDVGVGQLLGRLRNDARVVNLEGTNLAVLDTALVPEVVDLVTMDLSYLAVADAVPQLAHLDLCDGADLVTLVKPTFELRRSSLAASDDDLVMAVERAARGIAFGGWAVAGSCAAPATGQRGAREAFIYASRRH